jgi:hypothetical protein
MPPESILKFTNWAVLTFKSSPIGSSLYMVAASNKGAGDKESAAKLVRDVFPGRQVDVKP